MIRRFARRLRKNDSGASLIEFALVAILFFALIFGIIEFGWIFNGYMTLTSAAQEAARLAIVTRHDEVVEKEIEDKVIEHARFFKPSNLDINVEVANTIGGETEISVVGTLDLLIAFPPLPRSIILETSATMRQEQ